MKVFHAAPAGRRDLPAALRRGADAAVRHPDRRHGRRLRRPGELRQPGARAGRRAASTRRTASPTGRRGRSPPAQIAYAAADVTHLRRIYVGPVRPPGAGRPAGLGGRGDGRAGRARHLPPPTPRRAWERLRPRTSNRRFLGMLRAAAAWREREAQRVEHPAPAPGEGRDPAGDGGDRARRRRRPGPRARHHGGLRQGQVAAPRCSRRSRRPRRCPTRRCPRRRGSASGPAPSPALVALLKVLLAAKCRGAPGRAEAAGEFRGPGPPGGRGAARTCRRCTAGAARSSARRRWRCGPAALALGVEGRRIRLIRQGAGQGAGQGPRSGAAKLPGD